VDYWAPSGWESRVRQTFVQIASRRLRNGPPVSESVSKLPGYPESLRLTSDSPKRIGKTRCGHAGDHPQQLWWPRRLRWQPSPLVGPRKSQRSPLVSPSRISATTLRRTAKARLGVSAAVSRPRRLQSAFATISGSIPARRCKSVSRILMYYNC
jgi:hypothetical protein